MELKTFTVQNYRSITSANDLQLSQVTILLGKNNEGKSNILRALSCSMQILERLSQRGKKLSEQRPVYEDVYEWGRDYPKTLQDTGRKKLTDKYSVFTLEFRLSGSEIDSFRKEIGNNLNGCLFIRIKIGHDNIPHVYVVKRGKGSVALNAKSDKIATYIGKLIRYNYIPAIRTERDSYSVINDLVSEKLSVLELNREYRDAVETIKRLQAPVLVDVSKDIDNVLKKFIHNLSSVRVELNSRDDRRFARGRYWDSTIYINDGQETDLSEKGDGVKSLVTLGLLQNNWRNNGASIVAIEEPESHLHPEAINELRSTIYALASSSQVIVSTHNPLFVNRDDISANIVVNHGKASKARSLMEIRDVLGVNISDNLCDAELFLIVEGETDLISLSAIMSGRSKKIKSALDNKRLSIMPVGGTGNMPVHVNMCNHLVGKLFVYVDSDDAGKSAITVLETKNLLAQSDYLMCKCDDMKKSEFEDVVNVDCYKGQILKKYGVNIEQDAFKNKSLIWSDRVKRVFENSGKLWNEDIETKLKYLVANCVAKSPDVAIRTEAEANISSLIIAIEQRL